MSRRQAAHQAGQRSRDLEECILSTPDVIERSTKPPGTNQTSMIPAPFAHHFKGPMMKKPTVDSSIKPMPNAWGADDFKHDYPNLAGFLSTTKWDDGSIRVPGSMSIFLQLGVLKACLNDKDLKRVTYVEAPTWAELIQLLDMAVCAEDTVWKASSPKIPY